MLFLTGTLPLLLISRQVSALPAIRQSGSGISVQDAMAGLYNKYLQSQGVTKVAFYPLFGGEREIDFAGVGDSADMYMTNNEIFSTADSLPHMNTFNSTGDLMFSTQYRHFIQALQNATQSTTTPAQSQQLNDLAQNKTVACTTNLTSVTNDAYAEFQKEGGNATITSDVFIQFATQNWGQYTLAKQACDNAQNAYAKAVSPSLTSMRPLSHKILASEH